MFVSRARRAVRVAMARRGLDPGRIGVTRDAVELTAERALSMASRRIAAEWSCRRNLNGRGRRGAVRPSKQPVRARATRGDAAGDEM